MVTGIYRIYNKVENKNYIGSSVNILSRWQEHYKQGVTATYFEDIFHFTLNQYPNDFTFSILEICGQEDLQKREEYWMGYYNSIKEGYNKISSGYVNRSLIKKKDTPTREEIINMISSLINKPLFRQDKNKLVKFFNITKKGVLMKWPTVKAKIIDNGFTITETKRVVNGRSVNCSIIGIDWRD